MNRYFVVDNVIIGNNHIINNSGCINILQRLDSTDTTIQVFCEENHGRILQSKVTQVRGKSIEYHPIRVIAPEGSALGKVTSWVRKLREDSRFLKWIFDTAKRERPDLLFFCTIIPTNLFWHISLIRKNAAQKVIIGLHGEIEHLFRPDVSGKDRLNAFFYKKAFAASPPNLKYLVLSPLIKSKIVESGYLKAEQLLCIEHPANEATESVQKVNQEPVLASLGIASQRKNAGQIFKLGAHFQHKVENQQVRFQIIGKVATDTRGDINQYVEVAGEDDKPIEQAKYEQLILNADYSLSFITGYEYVFRISGSLIDSIQYHLPIIALRHDYILHTFQEAGDIGFICENLEEMYSVIEQIVGGEQEIVDRYPIQVANLKAYAKRFYALQNAEFLKEQLELSGWDLSNS